MPSFETLKLLLKKRVIFSSTLLFLIFIGCTCNEYKLTNLDSAKQLVKNYYESGQYDEECKRVIDEAISKIDTVNIYPNSAVVFDIDETALSNYKHTKEIGFGFIIKIWNQWLLKADAPAIPQTKRFYDWLLFKNIKIIFLTGRNEEVREPTLKNLIADGYTKFDTLIVRQPQEYNIPAAEFKAHKREELVKKGYKIIATIGDQWSDLVGGNTGIKIKLPNYLYIID